MHLGDFTNDSEADAFVQQPGGVVGHDQVEHHGPVAVVRSLPHGMFKQGPAEPSASSFSCYQVAALRDVGRKCGEVRT